MFDLGWGKLVVIALIALIVIGPKELPAVLRTVGQWMTKIRRMAAEFQGQFQEAMREAEMTDLKKHVDDIADTARNIGSGFNPLDSTTKAIEMAFEDKPASPVASGPAAESASAAEAQSATPSPPADPPAPLEPQLPFPGPAPAVDNKDIVGTAEPAPVAPAADAGGG